MEDYYSLLKIRRAATQDDVKQAYRRLARELHPDVNPDPEGQERFKKITQAYEVLSHTGKRRRYDQGFDPLTGRPLDETDAPWSPWPPPPPPRRPPSPTPTRPQPPRRRPPTSKKVFGVAAAAVALVVVVVVSLIVASPGTPPSSAATPPAFTLPTATSSASTTSTLTSPSQARAAAQINDLLNASAATTQPMVTALQNVRECYNISSDILTIRAVAYRYRAEYYQANGLDTGQLPNGTTLKNDLIRAFASSAWADLYFVEWAQQREASGCARSGAAAYNIGTADAAKANAAKDSFVRLWNPIAASNGLPSRSAGNI